MDMDTGQRPLEMSHDAHVQVGIQQATDERVESVVDEGHTRIALAFVLFSPVKFYSSDYQYISISVTNFFWLIIYGFKIGFLTKYTYDVGTVRSEFGVLVTTGTISLQHLLLKNWDTSLETLPYPPAHGEFAVYSIRSLEESIDFTVSQYFNAEQQATGYFTRTEQDNMVINIKYFVFNVTAGRYSELETKETSFKPDHGLSNHTTDGITVFSYNITKELEFQKLPSVLQSIIFIRISMSMHSVRVFENAEARCFEIYANVTFIDKNHNGQVKVQLTTLTPSIPCSDMNYDVKDRDKRPLTSKDIYRNAFGFLIASIFIEAIAALIWIAVGCGRKCEYKDNKTLRELDGLIVMLGCCLLLSYIILLKFIKINKKFSILFNTLKASALEILSFLVCVVIIFIGFWLFGFIVLGTYHVKFSEPLKAADTLFSVINGDEIYATLAMIQDLYAGDIATIDAISQVFVFTYVSIFTVLIFNLLIAVFTTAYEEVKKSSRTERNENEWTQILKLAKKHCDGGETLGSLLNRFAERRNYGTTGQNSVNSLLTGVLATVQDMPAANLTMDALLAELLRLVKNNSPGMERLDELIRTDQDLHWSPCRRLHFVP